MPALTNAEVSAAFDELADLYELDGALSYRVLAYRTAAKVAGEAPVSIVELARTGRAVELPGIGATLQDKICTLAERGAIPSTVRLREKYPDGLRAIMHLPGFGAKKTRRLFDELGVDSFESLKVACESHEVREIRGFGVKIEEALLEALKDSEGPPATPRVLLSRALLTANEIVAALQAVPGVEHVELAGSLRRMKETVKDIDIVVATTDASGLAAALEDLPVVSTVSAGEGGVRGSTYIGLPLDLCVVEPDQLGNALQHFTGAKDHNIQLRDAAVRKGLHVSEYGITDDNIQETIRCATEAEVYTKLGLHYIPPELREGRGEIQAAGLKGSGLPRLVEQSDIRGDLHAHTIASDGKNTIEQMAKAAIERGYEYLAITDHSASHGFGNDVSPDQLKRQIERVHTLRERFPELTLLIGTETNILTDGSLDYDDKLLEQLDWINASIHTSFRMDEVTLTARMIAAMEHPLVDSIGHPTGRKVLRREPYKLNIEKVIEAAARTGTFLEINAAPDRRDLNEQNAKLAAEGGVMIIINSDAHSTLNFDLMRYGVATARRAWLTREQIANTRSWKELDQLRKRSQS